MNPHNYAYLIFDKVAKNIWYDREKTMSSTKVAGKTGYLPAENWNWIHAYHLVLVSAK
jgi:hypothetical protein